MSPDESTDLRPTEHTWKTVHREHSSGVTGVFLWQECTNCDAVRSAHVAGDGGLEGPHHWTARMFAKGPDAPCVKTPLCKECFRNYSRIEWLDRPIVGGGTFGENLDRVEMITGMEQMRLCLCGKTISHIVNFPEPVPTSEGSATFALSLLEFQRPSPTETREPTDPHIEARRIVQDALWSCDETRPRRCADAAVDALIKAGLLR